MMSGLALKNVVCRGTVQGRVTNETPLAMGGQPLKSWEMGTGTSFQSPTDACL